MSEEVSHIKYWTGTGYAEATSSLDWYNPTFGVLDFPSEKIHEFNALPEPEQFGPEIVDAVVALEASIDRFRASVRQAQDWASSATPDTKRNVMDTMEFEPSGALGWRVRAFKAGAVEALSVSDRQWMRELYRRNRDAHIDGIGNSEKREGLFAAVGHASDRLEIAKERLKRPIRPRRFWIGHILAAVLGLIGIFFLVVFLYVGVATAKPAPKGPVRPRSTLTAPDSLGHNRTGTPVPSAGTRQGTAVTNSPAQTPKRAGGPSWTTGLTFWQHLYLVLFAAVLSVVFTTVQRGVGYVFDRDRRHHKAIAQLEHILGRRLHRLAFNEARVKLLTESIRKGALGSMFPAPLQPDASPSIELLNLGVMNAVTRVDERMEVLDFNAAALRAAYEKVRDGFASNPISEPMRDAYERNAGPMADQYDSIREEILATREELLRVLAWLKILGQRDKPGIRRFLRGRSLKSAHVTDQEIEDAVREIERLATEPPRFRKQGQA